MCMPFKPRLWFNLDVERMCVPLKVGMPDWAGKGRVQDGSAYFGNDATSLQARAREQHIACLKVCGGAGKARGFA